MELSILSIHAYKTFVCAPFTDWENPAPVPKIMALGRKIMALGHKVFSWSVKCFAHGFYGFNGVVQRRLATQTVTILTSCWQVLSEIELGRIVDVYKRLANSGFACICTEKYRSLHEATRAIRSLLVWKLVNDRTPSPCPRVCSQKWGHQVIKIKLKTLKSAATSNMRQYAGSEIFNKRVTAMGASPF